MRDTEQPRIDMWNDTPKSRAALVDWAARKASSRMSFSEGVYEGLIRYTTFAEWNFYSRPKALLTPVAYATLLASRAPDALGAVDGWQLFWPFMVRVEPLLPGRGTSAARCYLWSSALDDIAVAEWDETAF